ncbi:hypothetical protein [Cryptosporangium minutisporangium]|uniref:Uncharacterized protein n=1 Tax=Cryptosporangium minutisporangium TaxID=113569 RepID=A0ABP6T473_9ACTN
MTFELFEQVLPSAFRCSPRSKIDEYVFQEYGQLRGINQQLLAGAPSHGYGAIGHGGGHGYGNRGYDGHGYGAHHGHRTHRHGVGAVAGGAAAGFVGGMVAGELIDEAGDAFFDDGTAARTNSRDTGMTPLIRALPAGCPDRRTGRMAACPSGC